MPSLADIAHLRLRNQKLIGAGLASPADVVGWLGAVQSQDYAGARWGVGQRMKRASDAAVTAAYDAGEIIRTHVLRPTWHFVSPADLRWMLALTAPRVRNALRYYDEKLALDAATLKRSQAVLRRALAGGQHRTRDELAKLLADAGLQGVGQRLAHLMMHAELDALVCSGPMRGKQFTYALVDERVPAAPERSRDEALCELTKRYFTSHGPALAQDFAWWSGLTIRDANLGLELAGGALSQLEVEGRSYYHAGSARPPKLRAPVVHLLPNYDEHLIAYKERSATFDHERVMSLGRRENIFANPMVTLNGQVVGGWRRSAAQPHAPLEIKLVAKLSAAERKALKDAEARLAKFVG
jgi:hypothetical protein